MRKISLKQKAAAVVLGLALTVTALPTVAVAQTPVLRFEGSTTLYPIMTDSESAFETLYSSNIDVEVYGGGSGHGITTILQGSYEGSTWVPDPGCDIAMASRPAKSSDDTKTGTSGDGDPYGKLDEWAVGKDGVCVIVYDDPSATDVLDNVTSLTTTQLQLIYEAGSGITTMDWEDITGDSSHAGHPLIPRSRITDSGTRGCFLELTPIDETSEEDTIDALQPTYPRIDSNSLMRDAIAAGDNGMVGYVGYGYITDSSYNIRAIPVQDTTAPITDPDPVAPSEQTLLDGSYCLARDLYLYTCKPSYYDAGNIYIDRYLCYIFSNAGQNHVANAGFIRIDSYPWDVNLDGVCDGSDISQVTLNWLEDVSDICPPDSGNLTTTGGGVPSWIRQDIKPAGDGVVDGSDLGQLSIHFLDSWL